MLWQRVITAVPLAVLVIWVVLFQPGEVFFWLSLCIAALAGWEWAQLSGVARAPFKVVYAAALCALCWLLQFRFPGYATYAIAASVAWWVFVCAWLFVARPRAGAASVSLTKLLVGALVVPAAVVAMNRLHAEQHGQWLMFGLMLVWIADIGAYFSGRRFGRRKLAPQISPGKTVEGLLGGIAAVVIYSLIAAWYFALDNRASLMLVLLGTVLTLVSVAGDLYESILKRERGVKDSGAILPGHGGVLDRIDSLLAAMPVFALGYAGLVNRGWNL